MLDLLLPVLNKTKLFLYATFYHLLASFLNLFFKVSLSSRKLQQNTVSEIISINTITIASPLFLPPIRAAHWKHSQGTPHFLSADVHLLEIPPENPTAFHQSQVDATPSVTKTLLPQSPQKTAWSFSHLNTPDTKTMYFILIKSDQIIQAVTNLLPLIFSFIFRATKQLPY